jgi:acyl carrier protein
LWYHNAGLLAGGSTRTEAISGVAEPGKGEVRPMSDTADDIAGKVRTIIAERLVMEEAKVVPEASLVDDLGADSLDAVELVMAFEDAFSIEIPEDAAEKVRTVGDAINLIVAAKKGV